MDAATAADLAEAFLEHREAFGVPITVGETAITAVVNESPYGRELVEGGFAEEGDIEFKILLSDLGSTPGIATPVTYKGRTFRIQKPAIQPGSLIGEFMARPTKR